MLVLVQGQGEILSAESLCCRPLSTGRVRGLKKGMEFMKDPAAKAEVTPLVMELMEKCEQAAPLCESQVSLTMVQRTRRKRGASLQPTKPRSTA